MKNYLFAKPGMKAKEIVKAVRSMKGVCFTSVGMRDAGQSDFKNRHRIYDLATLAPYYNRMGLFSSECHGGIIIPDRITKAYAKNRAKRPPVFYKSNKKAHYVEIRDYDCSKIPLTVSCPHLPSNTKPASELSKVSIDQVVIGSCTNGRLEDLREAAMVIKGRKVDPNVRMIVIPATQKIYRQAMKEKLLDIFVEADAAVSTPTCGPCLGGYMGILAKGERALATTNRNFVGRMGHPESEVYLSNPAVAAASAVLGRIGTPEELGL